VDKAHDVTPCSLSAEAWHALPVAGAFGLVGSQPDGLDEGEAARRLVEFGPNRLSPPPRRGPLARFLLQFHNVLIYVLLVAGVITALLGEWVESGVIFGVVLINAIIGFVQEGKAERALEAIRDMLSLEARVLRGGERRTLPAEQVVPGEVILLQSGDKVPADARVFEAKNLRVQEAALTGESVPVEKFVAPVAANAALGDRASMVFAGTLVVYGQARAAVTATGDATEVGRIGTMLAEVQSLEVPLLRQMTAFGRWLTLAILGLAAFTFVFGLLVRDYAPSEMFMAAVGLAVAAIPEGLPAVLTITLALGVQTMARRNAIIRRLPAVETLGAITVICTDKTGTLTRNEMTTQRVLTATQAFATHGTGYGPRGGFTVADRPLLAEEQSHLEDVLRPALLCNDARLREAEGEWRVDGDPTEGALITAALWAGLDPDAQQRAWPRIDAIPFESEHRFMATLHANAGRKWILLKGAPETVLERCSYERVEGIDRPLELGAWQERVEALAAEGHRVLAVAEIAAPAEQLYLEFDHVRSGMTLLGLCGLIDPPREEAIASIAQCQSAGIRVKMITGDHVVTARAIAQRLGLDNPRQALSGPDLDAIPDDALRSLVMDRDVFARASPEHKLRLVEALQANGQVTAMTGDGVNDAPALKRADIGIAMGKKGTEAAKEAAEMVLADDNFATISGAVEEGRKVYDNLKKAILFILPTNAAEGSIIVAAVLLGYVLPITAVQILWINMVTAVTLGLALAFEPAEQDVMARPPRPPQEPILSGFLIWRIAFVAILLVSGTFGLFAWSLATAADLEVARTIAVNVLVVFEVVYLLNCRLIMAPSATREGLLGSRAVPVAIVLVLALQLLYTSAPPLQALFDSAALGWHEWLLMALAGLLVFAMVELEKAWQRRRRRAFARPRARDSSAPDAAAV
jgi:magnesium-transporting ATPase (P-type)